MYEHVLTHIGLDNEQVSVYETLLRLGKVSAGTVYKKSNLKRSLVYKVLNELVSLTLAERHDEKGKRLLFSAVHPMVIKELIEKKEQAIKDVKNTFDDILPSLVSDFNLAIGRPGVRFYEGIDGAAKVLFDSLHTKGTIFAYVDLETALKIDAFQDLNNRSTKKRKDLFIDRRVIMIDSPFVRQYLGDFQTNDKKAFTERRFFGKSNTPWQSLMQMYDTKVTYITLNKENIISVIIEDPFIFQLHKQLFEKIWSLLPDEYGAEKLRASHVEDDDF